jgi:Na+-driven multidrug efflux pump
MNPFGLLHAVFSGGLEMIAQALGRKRRPETRSIWFGVVYVVLLLLGLGVCIFVVWKFNS